MPGGATPPHPRARAAVDADVNRRAPLVWPGFGYQAPELLLGSAAPDAMPLSSGHGIGQALLLNRAAVAESQGLLLSLGR
jgi:hypothetical protein